MTKLGTTLILVALLATSPLGPAFSKETCTIEDRPCIQSHIASEAAKIENKSWRDQTYRELAKTYAHDGEIDMAVRLIASIESPDTKAMTIRGIGMAIAPQNYEKAKLDETFGKLRAEAEKIDHPPSYAIALTYIAMGQAFAADDEGAWKTASEMDNEALRHKAYGETAEIQAERGDFNAAMKSISFIESDAYRNKSYSIVSKILADQNMLKPALTSALKITNAYKQANALQYLLDQQKPREVERE